MRAPVSAGFYPSKKVVLDAMLKQLLSRAKVRTGIKDISGAVVLTQDIITRADGCQGLLAAQAVQHNHHSWHKPHRPWRGCCGILAIPGKRPLGVVETDIKLAERIVAKGSGILKFDEMAHSEEHSIEVQLPFLQYLFKDFKIVAISVSSGLYPCQL